MQLEHVLSKKQWRAYDAIAKAGTSGIVSDRLIDITYADDPEGGPLDVKNGIRAIIRKVNQKISGDGFRIVGTSRGGPVDNFYRLARIDAHAS